jgi:hypothetical protein
MMANEVGEWLWLFADAVLLIALAAGLLCYFVLLSPHGASLFRVKNFIPSIRIQLLGKTQHPQKTV